MKWLVAAATLLLVTGGAQAAATQSLSELQQAAVQAVRKAAPPDARVVADAEPLDPRLRLAACPGKLDVQVPDLGRGAARVSVSISCPLGPGWSLRVPVRVQLFRKVLVTTRPLARGDVPGAGDVRPEERDVARLGYGYIVDVAQLQGRHLRRPLSVGTVITPGMLTAREVVQRGQKVSLVASADGILVRAEGVALQAGDRGDVVTVRSLSCDCVVQGRVRAPGIVDAMP